MAGNVSALITSGFDAFTNLYDVAITFPNNALPTDISENMTDPVISVRALDFTPPELTVQKYKVSYKAIDIERLGSKIEGDRVFSLTFRIDADYYLYNALMKWKHIWGNPSDEGEIIFGSMTDLTDMDNYGTVRVRGHKSTTTLALSDIADPASTANRGSEWIFYQCILVKAGTPTYTRDSGSTAITVTSDFIFGEYNETVYPL